MYSVAPNIIIIIINLFVFTPLVDLQQLILYDRG